MAGDQVVEIVNQREERVSPWIKWWLVLHIVAITAYALPDVYSKLIKENREPVGSEKILLWNQMYINRSPLGQYCMMTGFWQRWDMFAPKPSNTDLYMTAEVKYKNGVVKVYQYPRLFTMGLWDKWLNERYRKYYERVNDDSMRYLRPPVANQIARKMNTEPGNPPVEVSLIRHWQTIMPPGQKQPTGYEQYKFYRKKIEPEDLIP